MSRTATTMRMITSSMAAGSLTKPTAPPSPRPRGPRAHANRPGDGRGCQPSPGRVRGACPPAGATLHRPEMGSVPLALREGDLGLLGLAVTLDGDGRLRARGHGHDDHGQVRRALDGLAVDRGDEVTGLDPCGR